MVRDSWSSSTTKFERFFIPTSFFSLLEQGLAPLCENMPSGKATKPGDVVTAKNGKTIQVGKQLLRCEAVRTCRERWLCFVRRLTTRMQRAG